MLLPFYLFTDEDSSYLIAFDIFDIESMKKSSLYISTKLDPDKNYEKVIQSYFADRGIPSNTIHFDNKVAVQSFNADFAGEFDLKCNLSYLSSYNYYKSYHFQKNNVGYIFMHFFIKSNTPIHKKRIGKILSTFFYFK